MPALFSASIITALQIFGIFIVTMLANTSRADVIHIAAASNFSAPMTALVDEFHKTSSHTVRTSFASSGKLFAQISNGAPFDLFFSADQVKPRKLIELGYAQTDNRTTYAIGALALLSNSATNGKPLDQLKDGDFKKIALANPKFAPYGIAALELLEDLGLVSETRKKWILGENISQTYQYVSMGNTDLGFVAWSQIKDLNLQKNQSIWKIPQHLTRPIIQDAVLLERAKNSVAALEFFKFLQSDAAVNIIRKHGYRVMSDLRAHTTDKGA